MRPLLALASSLALSLLAACGGTAQAPAAVAQEFLEALRDDDTVRMGSLLTPEARSALAEDESSSLTGEGITSITVGEESLEGSRAEVSFQLVKHGEEQDAALLLREVGDGWRVHGLRVAFGDTHLTLDFEEASDPLAAAGQEFVEELGQQLGAEMQQAFDEWGETLAQGGTLEEIAAGRRRFEDVVAVAVEDHERAWRIDVKFVDEPVREVLGELLGPDWTLDATGVEDHLSRGVTLESTGLSRIEAVERVARQVGVYPVWPALDGFEPSETLTVRFAAGARPLPVEFTGPFAVEVTDLAEDAPNTVGDVEFAVRSVGIAPSALAYQGETVELLTFERLRGPADEVLTDENVHHLGSPTVQGNYLTYRISKDLRGLLRSVTSFRATGALQLDLPTTVESVTWSRDRTEPMDTAFGTLSMESWGESVRFRLEGSEDASLEDVDVRLSPLRADGSPLGVHFASAHGWGRTLDANVDCPEAPATVELKLCRNQTVRHAFELGPVALARFAEQPTHLEPLTFEGAAPLALEFLGSRRENGNVQATVRATNRANKDAVGFTAVFYYLDGSGNVLKDFPHTFSGEWDFELGESGPAVPSAAQAELTTFAAFAPDDFATIRLELQRVTFPDGTSWPVDVQ